jgi:hypothetical protein
MKVEQLADGSLELRERWAVLRWTALLVAAGLIALVIPDCLGGGSCDRKEFRAVLIVAPLLIALSLWLPDATFLFDAAKREVRWSRRRMLGAKDGTIPFADIIDVRQRASVDMSEQPARTRYRIALITRTGEVYMSLLEAVRKSDEENIVALIRRTLALT